MLAKMKCSNCGAEMSNLNMTWGKKQMLLMIPLMLIGFLPLARMMFFKGDIMKELSISGIESRPAEHSLEIVGLITNPGSHDWSGITVEAEFFDDKGSFLNESTGFLTSEVKAGAKEHFKISIVSPSAAMTDPATKMVVKIAGGHTSPF